jgi:hypothetical protein
MTYPEYAEVAGKRYKINTDYRVALRCFEVIEDDSICDEERALAVIFLLFGEVPTDNLEDFLRIAGDYLRCGEKEETQASSEKDMDFFADEKYIVASFMSDYQIDLSRTDMHFWQYIQLIQGFTERSVMSRVREIRNYDLEELKDPKARAKMVKAKKAVALPEKFSKAEQEAIEEFEKLFEVG